jgi:hypothetical protein
MEGGKQAKKEVLPPISIGASKVGSPASTVSPITTAVTGSYSSPSTRSRTRTPTTPTTPSSRRLPRSKPNMKLTRRNPRAMQKHRINKLAISDFSKQALKRATRHCLRGRRSSKKK